MPRLAQVTAAALARVPEIEDGAVHAVFLVDHTGYTGCEDTSIDGCLFFAGSKTSDPDHAERIEVNGYLWLPAGGWLPGDPMRSLSLAGLRCTAGLLVDHVPGTVTLQDCRALPPWPGGRDDPTPPAQPRREEMFAWILGRRPRPD